MNKQRRFNNSIAVLTAAMLTVGLLGGCGSAAYVNGSAGGGQAQAGAQGSPAPSGDTSTGLPAQLGQNAGGSGGGQAQAQTGDAGAAQQPAPVSSGPGTRDNTPLVLEPTQPGTETSGNDVVMVDTSNSDQGYISVNYSGTSPKVKMQLTCPNTITYTYNLHGGYEVFPLTSESGTYTIGIFENITGTEYSTCFRTEFNVTISNEFGPYLYPNQYVNFTADSACVTKAEELAYSANTDLDVVTNVYNYMIQNVTYDTALANSVESGYLPDPDRTLATNTGICLDYACLTASMLRSQNIPTHMEVGYASTAYHAWISVYLQETGWVNGIIEFNGTSWELMDPTFAASASASELQEFIGDGSNYETKYIY